MEGDDGDEDEEEVDLADSGETWTPTRCGSSIGCDWEGMARTWAFRLAKATERSAKVEERFKEP